MTAPNEIQLGALRTDGGTDRIGVVPVENIRILPSSTGTTVQVLFPGSPLAPDRVTSIGGTHWAAAVLGPDERTNLAYASDPFGNSRVGIDLTEAEYGPAVEALTTAASSVAAAISVNPRASVQVVLTLEGTVVPEEGEEHTVANQPFEYTLRTPYVTYNEAAASTPGTDLSREDAAQFLFDELYNSVIHLLGRYAARDWFLSVSSVAVNIRDPPPLLRGGASLCGKSIETADNLFVQFSPHTISQCLLQCLSLGRNWAKSARKRRRGESERIQFKFLDVFSTSKEAQKRHQADTCAFRDRLKSQCSKAEVSWPGDGYGDARHAQIAADTYGCEIQLYNNAYIKTVKFIPDPYSPLRLQRIPPLPPLTSCIELRLNRRSHYELLVRKRALDRHFGEVWRRELADARTGGAKTIGAGGLDMYAPPAPTLPFGEGIPTTPPDDNEHLPLRVPSFKHVPTSLRQQDLNMLSYDTETYVKTVGDRAYCQLYATGCAYWDEQEGTDELVVRTHIFKGETSMDDMLLWLSSGVDISHERVNGMYIFAHNNSRFDVASLASSCALSDKHPFRLDASSLCENNGRWLAGKLYYDIQKNNKHGTTKTKRCSISMRDSCCVLPGPLGRLARDLGVPCQKESIDHDRIVGGPLPDPLPSPAELADPATPLHWQLAWDNGWDGKAETIGIRHYLECDVVSLLQVMQSYNRSVYEQFSFPVFCCPTAASVSKRIFMQRYYTPSATPLFTCSDAVENIIRAAFIGGRTEAFVQGDALKEGEKCYYMDATSLYPSVGREALPCGPPKLVVGSECDWRTQFGFMVCEVSTNRERVSAKTLPYHPIICNSRLVFCYLDRPVKMVLLTDAMQQCERLQPGLYNYRILYGYTFARGQPFARLFTDLVALKSKARREQRSAVEAAAKIVCNAAYGWTGLRWRYTDSMCLTDASDDSVIHQALSERRLTACSAFGRYNVVRTKSTISKASTCVQVAATIAARGRMALFEILHAILQIPGGRLLYCDTDSVMSTVRLHDHEHLRNKFQPDWNSDRPGAELGSFKNELDDILRKKGLRADDEGFDKLFLLGAKFYSLSYTTQSGEKVEINKAKGFKQSGTEKLKAEQYELMATHLDEIRELYSKGKKLTPEQEELADEYGVLRNTQLQLPFSKTAMLDTTPNLDTIGWRVRYMRQKRTFRPVYTKGHLSKNNNSIKPFTLTYNGLEAEDECVRVVDIVNN